MVECMFIYVSVPKTCTGCDGIYDSYLDSSETASHAKTVSPIAKVLVSEERRDSSERVDVFLIF